jgi:hypothetical protein
MGLAGFLIEPGSGIAFALGAPSSAWGAIEIAIATRMGLRALRQWQQINKEMRDLNVKLFVTDELIGLELSRED